MANANVELIIKARDDASKALNAVNQALEELAGVQGKVAGGSSKLSGALDRGSKEAKDFAAALKAGTVGSANAAEAALNKIVSAINKSTGALAQQKADLRESGQAYAALKAQAEAAAAAIKKLKAGEAVTSTRGGANANQAAALKAAEQAYKQLTREMARAEQAMQRQDAAITKSSAELRKLEQAAGVAEAGVRELAAAQNRAAAADGVAAQQRLATAYRGTGTAARATVGDVQRVGAALQQTGSSAGTFNSQLGRAIGTFSRVGPAANNMAAGLASGARGFNGMRTAMAAFYGDSRRALSLMQRIRGEVLSLTASFVGFYGIFRGASSVLTAFQTMESSVNRFSAAFGQNMRMTGAEIEFVRAKAKELGFEFGVLSDTYSNFLISASQAGIGLADTRKIFTSVIESARVLNLSTEQVEGVLTALSQIAGKGKVQMEELRQQLGDRFPGAVGIMAEALGYGKDELDKFYKAVTDGNVSAEEGLLAFANGLEQKFGPQLEAALDSTMQKIGEFQNLVFERKLTAAEGGFIDGLETALDALNAFLDSPEGVQFFEDLGAAMGKFLKLVPGVIDNLDKIAFAIKALIALKLSQVFGAGLAAAVSRWQASTVAATAAQERLNAALVRSGIASRQTVAGMTAASASVTRLTAVAGRAAVGLRGLWAALGGPVGAAVTIGSFFAIDKLTSANNEVDTLNDTLGRHREILGQVQAAYLEAASGAKTFEQALGDLTEIELVALLTDLRQELLKFRDDAANTLSGTDLGSVRATNALRDWADEAGGGMRDLVEEILLADIRFAEGQTSASDYADTLKEIGERAKESLSPEAFEQFAQLAEHFVKSAREGKGLEEAVAEVEAEIRVLNGTATEADKVLLGLATATEEAGDKAETATGQTEGYEQALKMLKDMFPQLSDAMEAVQGPKKLQADFEQLIAVIDQLVAKLSAIPGVMDGVAAHWGNLAKGFAAANMGLPNSGISMDGLNSGNATEAAAAMLRQFEGFISSPEWDVNHLRVGYGSDTITLSDGTIQEVVAGMTVSMEDANRDLYRRINTEFMPKAAAQIGEKWATLTPQQQGVMTSLAYNYGSVPDSVVALVKAGASMEEVANAIQSLTANASRRALEAEIYRGGGAPQPQYPAGVGMGGLAAYAPPPGTGAAGITGFNQAFKSSLDQMMADAAAAFGDGAVTITSGFRSVERQAELYRQALEKYGSPEAARRWVAPPGESSHNFGVAADLGFMSDSVKQWVHENASKYGLNFRMNNEDWHIEPAGARQYVDAVKGGQVGGAPGTYDAASAEAAAAAAQDASDAQAKLLEDQAAYTAGLNTQIEQTQFENSLVNEGIADREVALALREAELEAAAVGLELTDEQRAQIEAVTRAKFAGAEADAAASAAKDAQSAKLAEIKAAEEEVARLVERRKFLEEEIAYQKSVGNQEGAGQLEQELMGVNQQLNEAVAKATAMWQAMGGPQADAAIQKLQQTQAELARTGQASQGMGDQIAGVFVNAITGAIDRFIQRVAAGENAMEVFKEEFQRMAAEILIEIGKMIIKQVILNALQGVMGGGMGAAGAAAAAFHGGGVAGRSGGQTKRINPAIFAGAARYHGGGIAGLRPDEVPTILQRNEEILTQNDPRHRFNGGAAVAPEVTVVNAVDGSDALDQALSDSRGRKTLVNWMRANRGAVKAALEG